MGFFQPDISQTMDEHARWAIKENALTEADIATRLARKGYKRPLAYVQRFMSGGVICANPKFIMSVCELCDERAASLAGK